jgi:phage FluMu protein Com
MEIPNPCRKTTVQCPKCQNVNEYSDAELEQVDATVHLIDEQ